MMDKKFSTFAQFRAVLLWPYDMDLITFYEFYGHLEGEQMASSTSLSSSLLTNLQVVLEQIFQPET